LYIVQILYYQNADNVVLARIMEHLVTIDIRAPLAFNRTPLSIALEGMRGPRTPCSPERTDEFCRIRNLSVSHLLQYLSEAIGAIGKSGELVPA